MDGTSRTLCPKREERGSKKEIGKQSTATVTTAVVSFTSMQCQSPPRNSIISKAWAVRRIGIFFLVLGTCSLVAGCPSKVIWTAESKSPDGKFIAMAKTTLNSGPGINGINTAVYLNWTTGRQDPVMILALADGSDAPIDTGVNMKWLNSKHLELTYAGNRSLGFQACKFGDADISIQVATIEPKLSLSRQPH